MEMPKSLHTLCSPGAPQGTFAMLGCVHVLLWRV